MSSPEVLYLDLLKRCLTRSLFDDDLLPVVPIQPWKRRLWTTLEPILARRGLKVLREVPLARSARDEGRIWPVSAETMVGLPRLDNLQHCIEQVMRDEVRGDLIETGVWRGGASIFMRAVLAAYGDRDRTVWVADSFQGLPPPNPDQPADAGDEHSTFSYLAVSLEQVQENFARYGLLDEQVRFLPGWFSESLPDAPIEQLAILRLDGDMYSSTMDVLRELYPKVAPGGFVIVDDYGAIDGCRAAIDEYRGEHGISARLEAIDWTGVFWRRPS